MFVQPWTRWRTWNSPRLANGELIKNTQNWTFYCMHLWPVSSKVALYIFVVNSWVFHYFTIDIRSSNAENCLKKTGPWTYTYKCGVVHVKWWVVSWAIIQKYSTVLIAVKKGILPCKLEKIKVNNGVVISVIKEFIWAPSSDFVSSSIPSWQILTAHVQPFRGVRDLAFCLKVPLDSLLVWASSGGSGETARMRRLAWTFAARIGDKYQIRLTRSIWFNLTNSFFTY